MVQKPGAQKRQVRLNATSASKDELEGLDGLAVRLLRGFVASEFWVNLLGFVILEMAIVIGWIAAIGWHVNTSWKSVLIALAAAALGFGAANLVARRAGNSRGRELERDYEALKERSSDLLAAVDRFEKKSRSSESSASAGPAP